MLAIRNRLREPDVIAVQEVAVFADGANALTGLAQALGNYTPLHRAQQRRARDRPRLPGQERHDRVQRRGARARSCYTTAARATCDLTRGKLFDRAPYKLDLKKGDISFVAMSNHFASQSHENACRIAESEAVRRQTGRAPAGGQATCSWRATSTTSSSPAHSRLTQGNMLTNLWSKAPAGLAYSYKFNGHLQTLDHILVTAGLDSRVTDMRYVHFDNDVYERTPDRRHRHLRPRPAGRDLRAARREHEHAGRRSPAPCRRRSR